MSLPALVKTYQISKLNQTVTATGVILTTLQNVLYGIVQALTTFGSNPWVEVSSCDSTATGTGKWSAANKLIWGSGAHSWIVLKQTGLGGTGCQICIECITNFSWQITVAVSFGAGFTGGSTTARPTATDEKVLISSGQWAPSADNNVVYHVLQSTDGAITRILVNNLNLTWMYCGFEVPANVVSGWSNPMIAVALGGGSSAANPTYANLSTSSPSWCRVSGTNYALNLTAEAFGGNALPTTQNYPNDVTSDYPFYPIGVFSQTAPARGKLATMVDLWWGLSSNTTGDSYPQAAVSPNFQFAQFGGIIIPWDSTNQPKIA